MYCVDKPVITKDHLGVSIKSNSLLKECNYNCHFNCVRILEADAGTGEPFLYRGADKDHKRQKYVGNKKKSDPMGQIVQAIHNMVL